MLLITRRSSAAKPRARPTPITAPTAMWVVETGIPVREASTTVAAAAIGMAQAAYDAALNYSKERTVSGQALSEYQATQFKLADMAVSLEASRLLCYKAAWLKDHGGDYVQAAAMAKLFASETCSRAANHAIQVFGGYGYCNDYPVERFLRDAKITEHLQPLHAMLTAQRFKRLLLIVNDSNHFPEPPR